MRECDCSETCTSVLMLQADLCLAADRNSGLWGQNLLLNWGKPEDV